jgi:phosphohistidine swiveling domain-containing protein/DNA-binding transcriptional ArsR family regulator
MIEKLFSSQVTFAVLNVLFKTLDKSLSTSELVKATNKSQTNIKRELDKLVVGELVSKIKNGNQNYYRLNNDYRFFGSLKNLFTEYNTGSKKYFLFNEENGTCFLSVDFVLQGYMSDHGIKKGIIKESWPAIAVYKADYGRYYFEKEIIERGAEESLKKLLQDPSFVFETIYIESVKRGEEAQEIFKKLQKNNFKISKKAALELIDRFLEIISVQVGLNTIAVFDLKDQLYSNYLKNYLLGKVKKTGLNLSVVMEKLLAPEKLTYTQLLRIELLKLVLKYKQTKFNVNKEIERLQTVWGWLNYGYIGPGLGKSYFEEIFKELNAHQIAQLKTELNELLNNEQRVKSIKNDIYRKLSIDKKHQNFINALGVLSYLKIYRKDTAFLIFSCLYQILAKLAPDYKRKDLFNLTVMEAKDLLQGKLKVSLKELRERSNYCAYIYDEGKFLYGEEVDKCLTESVTEEIKETTALKSLEGTIACLGKTGNWIYGEVKIINSISDIAKMRQGDILVSVATTPDVLPAMKKAAAIVTDQGGITCHAAIVSRELNIPCLIATKYATKVFKDGDKVVVCPRHNYIKFQ